MSKRPHSPDYLPEAKRVQGLESSARQHVSTSSFDALYDEVILVIFSCLSYNDLCAVQPVCRDWSRLALDNHVRDKYEQADRIIIAEQYPLSSCGGAFT